MNCDHFQVILLKCFSVNHVLKSHCVLYGTPFIKQSNCYLQIPLHSCCIVQLWKKFDRSQVILLYYTIYIYELSVNVPWRHNPSARRTVTSGVEAQHFFRNCGVVLGVVGPLNYLDQMCPRVKNTDWTVTQSNGSVLKTGHKDDKHLDSPVVKVSTVQSTCLRLG